MYANKNTTNSFDIMEYIKGTDIFNSSLINELIKAPMENANSIETVFYKGRLDLIANHLYGAPNYISILSIVNRLDPNSMDYGKITYLSQFDIESLIVASVVNAL